MRLVWLSWTVVVPCLLSCRAYIETKSSHVVHMGESAVLADEPGHPVCAALAISDVYTLARAIDTHDAATVKRLIESGKAVELPENTRVRVLFERVDKRQVRIQEGPKAGTVVWVPFEWLKPVSG